ncbi:MAG: TIGR00730 family Rossman fold protein [Chlorobi bacterium]|nr:TIGR00730 family Rossman fold protein [Chlorobiota bacterium]
MEKNICVFCSSSNAVDKIYYEAAIKTANEIVKNKYTLLFGGANVGLMRELAVSVKQLNGKSTGVIPRKIKNNNLACKNLDNLIVTTDMHSRKAKLEELADVFIALPGGFGTLEELSEVITLRYLGYHDKPVIILNINGFYDKLLDFYEVIYTQNFAKEDYRKFYFEAQTVEEAFEYIKNYKPEADIKKRI